MTKHETTRRIAVVLLTASLVVAASAPCVADARSEYLINMLESGSSFRVKVQAANTLGQIRCADAVASLSRALFDEHELVVIAAAVALGQIADPSVIPEVEKALAKPPSAAARSQLEMTLRVLKALTGAGAVEDAAAAAPEFLIRVDAMGSSADTQRTDVAEEMRRVVLERLRREPGVVIQEPTLKGAQVKAKLKKEKLRGYILSGSILRMEQTGDKMVVKVSLNVFSNPDYNLLMMPSAEGAVSVIDGPLTRETERAAQDKALAAVVEALVGNIFQTLHTSDSE